MPVQKLSLDTLGDLDHGFARAAIDKALDEMVRDLEDRGNDEQKRSVTIIVDVVAKEGLVITGLKVKTNLPDREINKTVAELKADSARKGYCLEFRSDNPTNPRQPTFDDAMTDDDQGNNS